MTVAGDGAMVIFASRRQDAARHSPAGASSLRWLCARLSLSLLREDRMLLGIARREQVPCLCTGLSLSSPQPKMNCYVIVLRCFAKTSDARTVAMPWMKCSPGAACAQTCFVNCCSVLNAEMWNLSISLPGRRGRIISRCQNVVMSKCGCGMGDARGAALRWTR